MSNKEAKNVVSYLELVKNFVEYCKNDSKSCMTSETHEHVCSGIIPFADLEGNTFFDKIATLKKFTDELARLNINMLEDGKLPFYINDRYVQVEFDVVFNPAKVFGSKVDLKANSSKN